MAVTNLPGYWSRHKATLRERLDRGSEDGPNGCRLWRRNIMKSGYGSMWWQGDNETVHRLSWMEVNGPIPTGMHVCHRCDVRICVNPDHLFLGTPGDNMRDRDRKGRQNCGRGEKHGGAKLTVEQVQKIREAVGTQRHIAALFGISQSVVCEIRSGKAWRENPDHCSTFQNTFSVGK